MRIEQVLVSLVNNAIKYAPDSETIQINVATEDGRAKMSVIDKGVGIPPEKLPRLLSVITRQKVTEANVQDWD